MDPEAPSPLQRPADIDELSGSLALIAELSGAFASSLDLDETLNAAITRVMHYLDAEAASIFLLDENRSELVCRASAGPNQIQGMRIAADAGIAGRTLRERQPVMVRDVAADPSFTRQVDRQTGFKTRSLLCAPLRVQHESLGAIEVVNKRSRSGLFEDKDLKLLAALAASAALAIRNAAMAARLVQQQRLEKELEVASEIQRNLLPKKMPSDYPVHGLNIPVHEVSGDFFDHLDLADGRIGFVIADVSGKGINAALLMAKTCSLFRCLCKELPEPGRLLARINREILETNTRGMFVTLLAGVLDPASGEVVLANAGHPPALLYGPDAQGEYVEGAAPPLGILADQNYPETRLDLTDGLLCLYTDGVIELQRKSGGRLGLDGLRGVLAEQLQRGAGLDALVETIGVMCEPPRDDVTLLMVGARR